MGVLNKYNLVAPHIVPFYICSNFVIIFAHITFMLCNGVTYVQMPGHVVFVNGFSTNITGLFAGCLLIVRGGQMPCYAMFVYI